MLALNLKITIKLRQRILSIMVWLRQCIWR